MKTTNRPNRVFACALSAFALIAVTSAQTFEYRFSTVAKSEMSAEQARAEAIQMLNTVSGKANPTEAEIGFIVDQYLRYADGVPYSGTFAFGIDGTVRTVRSPQPSPVPGFTSPDSFYYTDGTVLFTKSSSGNRWNVEESNILPDVSHPGSSYVFARQLDERFQVLKVDGNTVTYGFTVEQKPANAKGTPFEGQTYTLTNLMTVQYSDPDRQNPTLIETALHYGPLETWESSRIDAVRQYRITGSFAVDDYIVEQKRRNESWTDETVRRYELSKINAEVWTPETHLEHGTSIYDARESIGEPRSYRWTGSLYEPPVAGNIPMFVWPLGGALLCLGAGVFFWRKR
jgi:hypothetical protein